MKPLPFIALCGSLAATSFAETPRVVLADVVVDLRTTSGASLVGAQWRYHDANVVEVDHRAPGPDMKPSGAPLLTHDITPKAGALDFDDSSWEKIPAASLETRRSTGRLAFSWYRLNITVPEMIGRLPSRGATLVLELVVDDYAEVWVDGQLPLNLGSTGGALPSGWNSLQRVVLTRDAHPGQHIQVAIFAANGPLSDPPANYIWLRSATLDCYRPDRAASPVPMD